MLTNRDLPVKELILLSFTFVVTLFAQANAASVVITSPASGSTVVAGQPESVTVVVTGVAAVQGVAVLSPAFGTTPGVSAAQANLSVVFPKTALGMQQMTGVAILGPGNALFSNPINVMVVPAAPIQSIRGNLGILSLSYVGESAQMWATGTLTDGTEANITGLPSTKVSSQNTAVATVDSSGNVVAVGVGTTTIIIQNGGLSASIAVSVASDVKGDLNGDGKVNQDDLNILLGALGTQVAPGDARNLDGSGVIDEQDVQALEALCSPPCIPGGYILPVTSVVNAASFALNSLAPGGLFTIFTYGLSMPTVGATDVPFPVSVGGVSVQVNGLGVPLLYVSPTQVNAQLPYETPPGPANLVLEANGSYSAAIPVVISPTAPGLFLYQGNRAVVQNQDYTLNASANPANVGSVIFAYYTGQGPLDRPVSTGAAAPSNVLSRPTNATLATVGGLPAQVLFSGMTPGFVGLAQANIVIPNLASGDYPLVIIVGGVASNGGVISVRGQ